MEEFDWISAMMGVDILQVEAVGEIVGRTIGAVYKGVEASVDKKTADKVITIISKETLYALTHFPMSTKETNGQTNT